VAAATLEARSPGAVLAEASFAQAAVSLVNFGLPAIGPELLDDFDLTLFELGAVLTAGLLGAGVALIGAGVLVARIGARRSMLAGTALGTLGLAVAAASSSKEALYSALFVFGIGSAAVPIAGTGALFRVYPPARRGWALGVRQTAVPLGGAVAAVLYPTLYAVGGARLTLAVSAGAVAVSGGWFAFGLPSEHAHVVARRGPALRSILRSPGVTTLLAVAACYIVVLQALLAFIVPAVREAGHSELTASVAYFGVNAAAMVARIAWGSAADREGGSRRVRTLVEVGVLASAGAVVFAFALHGGPVAVVLAAIVFGLGALGWNALVYVSAGERVDPALATRSVAVAATVVFVLSGLATPLLGALVDAAGWDALWLATALIAGIGAYLAHRLPRQSLAGMD
jgi:MFS family permease